MAWHGMAKSTGLVRGTLDLLVLKTLVLAAASWPRNWRDLF